MTAEKFIERCKLELGWNDADIKNNCYDPYTNTCTMICKEIGNSKPEYCIFYQLKDRKYPVSKIRDKIFAVYLRNKKLFDLKRDRNGLE